MSGGKKKLKPRRTYTEGEYVRAVRTAVDESVKKLLLLYITAVAEKFHPSEEDLVDLLNMMQRYQRYEEEGLCPLEKYSEVLLKYGVDLRLSRW